MSDLVVKKSAVRDEADDFNVGGGFYEELDGEVRRLIQNSVQRAEDNGRRTVKARDV